MREEGKKGLGLNTDACSSLLDMLQWNSKHTVQYKRRGYGQTSGGRERDPGGYSNVCSTLSVSFRFISSRGHYCTRARAIGRSSSTDRNRKNARCGVCHLACTTAQSTCHLYYTPQSTLQSEIS